MITEDTVYSGREDIAVHNKLHHNGQEEDKCRGGRPKVRQTLPKHFWKTFFSFPVLLLEWQLWEKLVIIKCLTGPKLWLIPCLALNLFNHILTKNYSMSTTSLDIFLSSPTWWFTSVFSDWPSSCLSRLSPYLSFISYNFPESSLFLPVSHLLLPASVHWPSAILLTGDGY